MKMEVKHTGNDKGFIRSTFALRLTVEELKMLSAGEMIDRVVWKETTSIGTVETCVSVLMSPAGHQAPEKL